MKKVKTRIESSKTNLLYKTMPFIFQSHKQIWAHLLKTSYSACLHRVKGNRRRVCIKRQDTQGVPGCLSLEHLTVVSAQVELRTGLALSPKLSTESAEDSFMLPLFPFCSFPYSLACVHVCTPSQINKLDLWKKKGKISRNKI